MSKPWGRLRQIFVAFSEKLNFDFSKTEEPFLLKLRQWNIFDLWLSDAKAAQIVFFAKPIV
jgi:hypothetical protein